MTETLKIVTLEGTDLVRFHDLIRDLDRAINDGSFERVQLMIDAEGIKIKPDRHTWSPGLGVVREEPTY